MQLGRTLGECCDPKQGRGVTQLKCQLSIGCAAVATSTGRVAKLVAMKAPNLEPRGSNPKSLHSLTPLSPLSWFQRAVRARVPF